MKPNSSVTSISHETAFAASHATLDTTSKSEAERILRKRLQDVDAGRPTGPQIEQTTVGDVLKGLITDYTVNGRKSLRRVEDSAEHLKGFFGEHAKARAVDEARIGEYVAHRQKEKAANGTINRELTALRRAFRLAEWSNRVARVPRIAMLKEAGARAGFVERERFEAIKAALPPAVRPVAEVAYLTGWRVASEVLTREWRHVDFAGGWLRLEPGETKNGKPRMFPLTPDLRAVLEAQRTMTEAVELEAGRVIPYVFHRHGEPIVSFRRSWQTAVAAVGLPHLIPHDLGRRERVKRRDKRSPAVAWARQGAQRRSRGWE